VRALHAALALAADVPTIHAAPGLPLQLRVGVATGLVAVGLDQGVAVAGTTPNLAARVQATVPPGGIGVAPGTRRIAGAAFAFEDFGEHELKGFDGKVAVALLKGAQSLDSRSAWRGRDASLPMVGRREELAALRAAWDRATTGRTCGALLLGEAGLGKSRLVTALEAELPPQGHTLLRLQCSPFHVNSALQPFVQHLSAAAGLAAGDHPQDRLDKLEAQLAIAGVQAPRDRALVAALLGLPYETRFPPLSMPPPMQLQLTKEVLQHYFAGLTGRAVAADRDTMRRYLVGLAEARPLLLVIEDMHWIDPTSLELVDLLLAEGEGAPILLVMTSRPEFRAPWPVDRGVVELPLQRLGEASAREVARQQARRADLPAEWLEAIVERTDGVPLFIEEMTRMLLDAPASAAVRQVPDTLMDLLTARLDRLPPEGKAVAQLAAVIGRSFDRDLLATAAPAADAAHVESGLGALLASGLALPESANGRTLMFKHALIEDTAYASLPPKRCAELHGRVAEALLQRFTDRVQGHPELAAHHLTRAGKGLEAAPWWQAAGGQALSRGAPREAAGHLRAGVEALEHAPQGQDRDAAELGLLSMLGPTTMVLLGPGSQPFGDVQRRAYALSQSLPGRPRLFPTTYGWCLYNWGRAQLTTAGQLVRVLLEGAAAQPGDTEAAMAAHNMAGMVAFHRGRPEAARNHFSQSTALYEPGRDAALYPVYLMDFGVFGRFYLALATQVLGFPDAARRIAAEALVLAQGLNQPHTMGFAMLANFNTSVMRGDAAEALPMAERCIEFASQFGFPEFIAMARVARGWCRAQQPSRAEDGLAELMAGHEGWAATGFENWQPWFTVLAAEILLRLGRPAEALERLDAQLARIAANGERQFESPLRAERAAALAALPSGRPDAPAAFDQALAIAHEQGAGAWKAHAERRLRESLG
jgi:tetratricopeptide (TPR) repeat protein